MRIQYKTQRTVAELSKAAPSFPFPSPLLQLAACSSRLYCAPAKWKWPFSLASAPLSPTWGLHAHQLNEKLCVPVSASVSLTVPLSVGLSLFLCLSVPLYCCAELCLVYWLVILNNCRHLAAYAVSFSWSYFPKSLICSSFVSNVFFSPCAYRLGIRRR